MNKFRENDIISRKKSIFGHIRIINLFPSKTPKAF